MELDRSSLSRQVYEDIVTRIRNRTIHQGQKITLRHIQETYDVSSSPARDAISLLVRYGFVEIQPGGGSAVVVVMDEKKTRDTLELFACNCHSAAKLVLRHNKAQVLALVKENFGLQLQHQNAPAAMRARIYGDLINLFVDNTGNSLFANTVDPNLGRMVIAFGDYAGLLGTEETLELTRRLIEAMETGDDDTVIDIMTRQYELFLAAVK